MTYFKPELLELVHAPRIIQKGNSDDGAPDKMSIHIETFKDSTSTAAAYEADE